MESSFQACYDNAFEGWEQKVNDNGVIYYVDNEHCLTSWNHPYLDKILKDLVILFADIRYAAYRTALKLRTLQLQLGLQWINIQGIVEIFPVPSEENEPMPSLYVTYEEALMLIEKALHASNKEDIHKENFSRAADLILNFLANLYDRGHSGNLVQRGIQNALVALCGAKLSDKYKFFCSRVQEQHFRISREQLEHFIDDLMQIPHLLKEGRVFGIDVTAAVDSCFNKSPFPGADSISQSCFYAWLFLEPQTLVWLPTLHRTIATENVQHVARCSACRIYPITGFRYKCLACFGYNLCQNCFLLGRFSLSHKLTHPVKEYCLPLSTSDNTKAWLSVLKYKLLRRRGEPGKVAYLPVEVRKEQSTHLNWEPNSVEVDQGMSLSVSAELCGDSKEMDVRGHIEPTNTDEDEEKQKALAKTQGTLRKPWRPLEAFGQPCDSSSPFMKPVTKDQNVLSKQDIDCQQRLMALKIEELQQENKILKQKLQAFIQWENGNDSKEEIAYSAEVPLKEMQDDSPISPICEVAEQKDEEEDSDNSKTKHEHDTLALVGAFTPVRGATTLPSIVIEPPSLMANDDTLMDQDFTDPSGLQYKSSDMSLLSHDISSPQQQQQPHKSGMVSDADNDESVSKEDNGDLKVDMCSESEYDTMPSNENYVPSDMSLLCFGLSKNAVAINTNEIHCFNSNDVDDGEPKLITMTLSEMDVSRMDSLCDRDAQEKKSQAGSAYHSDASLERTHDSLNHRPKNQMISSPRTRMCKNVQEVFYSPETAGAMCLSMDLSNIHPSDLLSDQFLCSHDSRDILSQIPEEFATKPRRRTLEPVHMSTPVSSLTLTTKTKAQSLDNLNPENLERYQQGTYIQDRLKRSIHDDKENLSPLVRNPMHQPQASLATSVAKGATLHKEVLSCKSFMNRHNASPQKVHSDKESNNYNRTNMSQTFNCSSRDSQTMLTQDRDELKKIMEDFEQEINILDGTQTGHATRVIGMSDSSVMAAALNIGDAMAEFVQAVAKQDSDSGNVSLVTEMTQF